MELQQLRYFKAVAEAESMTKATHELFITQPNLSKSLTRLEQELGVPLFHRRKGKISLTEYGKLFLTCVNQSLSTLDNGRQELLQRYHEAERRLSLGCMLDDTGWIKDFLVAHPDITLRQYRNSRDELTQMLLDGTIDVAIMVLEPQHKDIVFEKLYESEYVIVMSPDHPLARKEILEIADLDQVPFILDDTRANRQIFGRICQSCDVRLQVKYDVRHVDLLYALVEQNMGIGMLPVNRLAESLAHAPELNITYRRVCSKEFPRPFWGIAFRRDCALTETARLCRDFFRNYMEQGAGLIGQLPGWKE